MIKAIFYKELIKCRAVLMLLAGVAVALVVYLFISNSNLLRTSGAVALWGQIAEGKYTLFSTYFRLFMPLSAIAIAAMQYVVEMVNKRFKLTLHLPRREESIVGAMQLFGVAMVLSIYVIMLLPSYVGLSIYYPSELVCAMFASLMPYMLAGVASYFFVMWIVVEPRWRRRVVYLFISLVSLSPFTIEAMLGATKSVIPSLLLIVVASVAASYYSASRFKDGAQN